MLLKPLDNDLQPVTRPVRGLLRTAVRTPPFLRPHEIASPETQPAGSRRFLFVTVEPIADRMTGEDHLSSEVGPASRADTQFPAIAIAAMEPADGCCSRDESNQPSPRLRAAVPRGFPASAHLTDLRGIDAFDAYAAPVEPQAVAIARRRRAAQLAGHGAFWRGQLRGYIGADTEQDQEDPPPAMPPLPDGLFRRAGTPERPKPSAFQQSPGLRRCRRQSEICGSATSRPAPPRVVPARVPTSKTAIAPQWLSNPSWGQQLLKDCILECKLNPILTRSMSIAASTSTDKIIVDKSRSHRNKAVSKTVRATRQRLQTGSSAPSGFEREMLLLHIESVLHGAMALPLLVILIAASGIYLSGDPHILAWALLALSAHAVTIFLARKAKREDVVTEKVSVWRRRFLASQMLTGLCWAIFTLPDCASCGEIASGLFEGTVLFIALAVTAMGTFLLRNALYYTFLPVLAALGFSHSGPVTRSISASRAFWRSRSSSWRS